MARRCRIAIFPSRIYKPRESGAEGAGILLRVKAPSSPLNTRPPHSAQIAAALFPCAA